MSKVSPMPPAKKPTILELFAAFAAQLPLLTKDDLASTVEAMRASSGFRRMMQHAREQAEAIGLPTELLDRPIDAGAASEDEADEPASPPGPLFPLTAAG